MAVLYFRVSAQYDEVIRLRQECEKLEAQLKKMDVNKAPAAARALETQLASAKQQMMGLVTEAAKAGAVMENNLKSKLDSASKASDELTEEIIKQRKIIRDTQDDVRRLSDEYSKVGKYSPNSKAKLAELNAAKAALNEQRYSLGELQDQQARNRLEVRKLTREYKEFSNGTTNADVVVKSLTDSLKRTALEIGGLTAIKKFGSDVIDATGRMQQLQVALSTILQDKSKADQLIAEIIQFAAKTPFNLDDVANGAKQLLAYGSSADKVVGELSMLGDVASGLQIPIGQLIYLYGTLRTQGRAMTVDIRQFAGRGIPIYEELAKVLGVTKDQVGELVKEGKVGFAEVEQAFKNMTSEGGKFANLMESSAGTWPQRLSNIGDTLFQKMNEFGNKYKEVFEFGIGTTEDLVESLDDVLAVIGGLIAAYGTYKAALITTAIAQKAVGFVDSIRLIGMYRKDMELATAAQQAFNAASKSNVYIALLSALVGIGTAIYMFSKNADNATKAQRKLNETIEEFKKSVASEQLQVDRLFDKLRTAKEGTDEYNNAKQAIIDQYGSYLDGMSAEIRTLKDVEGAYRAVNDAIIDAAKARAMEKATKDAADDYVEKEAEARERLRKALESKYGNQKDKEGNVLVDKYEVQLLGTLDGKTRVNSEFLKQFDEAYVNTRGTAGIATTSTTNPITEALFDIKKAKQTYDDIVKQAEGKFTTTSKLGTTGTDDTKKVFSDIAKETANAIENVRTLKQELADLRSGKTTADGKSAKAAIEEKEKELKDAENTLATLTGRTGGGSSRAAKEEEQKQKDIAEAALKAQEDADAAKLALERSYITDKVKLLEFDKEQELKAIDERIKAARSAEEKSSLEDLKATTTKKYDTQIADETKSQADDRLKQQEADWDEAIMKFGTYQQKKLAIERKYDKEIADAQNAGQEWAAIEAKKAALQSLDEQYGKSTQAMADLFEDAGEKSVGEIQKIIDKYELLIKFLSGTEQPDGTAVSTDELKAVGFTDKDIEKIQRGEISIKDVTDAVKGLKGEVAGKSPWQAFVSDMEKAIDKLKSTDGDPKKVGQGIMDISNAVTSFAPAVDEFANNIASIFGAEDTNITEIANAIGGLGQTAAGVGQILSGDIIGGAMAAVGGISQVVSAIKQIHDKKNEKQIEKLQDQIDALDRSYDKLGRDVEKAYSVDASDLIEQQNELLEQQKVLIQGQIAEERAKKNSDDERIKEWQNQLDDINEQIEDNADKQIEAIAGTSVMSAIDEFAQAYADAWENGTDAAEASSKAVKNLLKTSILNFLKSQLSPDVKQFMSDLATYMSDGIISPWEDEQLNKLKEKMDETAANYYEQTGKYFEDSKAKEQQSASGRGFGTEMTHEDAGELSGRFTAVYESNLRIENATQQQTVAITELHGSISALTAQASGLYNIADETRTILANSYLELQQIRENTGEIIKPIKQIQADMAEVKRNTSRL